MTQLANLLPAIVGAVLGVVALISAHAATRRLVTARQAARETTLAAEPELPMAHAVPAVSAKGFEAWYGGSNAVPGKKR